MAIEIIKNETRKKKIKPYYLLTMNYMIGDADGKTSLKMSVSLDNPNVEQFCKILRKLKPTKGTWGIILNRETIDTVFAEKQISKKEYEFMKSVMFYGDEENDYKEGEFSDIIDGETEYSFLVFQTVDLEYIDENGSKHQTKFVKG